MNKNSYRVDSCGTGYFFLFFLQFRSGFKTLAILKDWSPLEPGFCFCFVLFFACFLSVVNAINDILMVLRVCVMGCALAATMLCKS